LNQCHYTIQQISGNGTAIQIKTKDNIIEYISGDDLLNISMETVTQLYMQKINYVHKVQVQFEAKADWSQSRNIHDNITSHSSYFLRIYFIFLLGSYKTADAQTVAKSPGLPFLQLSHFTSQQDY